MFKSWQAANLVGVNQRWEEPNEQGKAVRHTEENGLGGLQECESQPGAAGVDGQSIEEFETRLAGNLYKLWNRLSSGSYMPPPVRRVTYRKQWRDATVRDSDGSRPDCARGGPACLGTRSGIVVPSGFYGYRPGRSAIDAVRTARERCWRYDWIVDLDIKSFFDSIDWELLLRAVRKHAPTRWVVLYIERWLKAPAMEEDGTLAPREHGTPQGGVISPLLANLVQGSQGPPSRAMAGSPLENSANRNCDSPGDQTLERSKLN